MRTVLKLIGFDIKDLVRALNSQKLLLHQRRGSIGYKDLESEIEKCYHRCRNRPRTGCRKYTCSVASGDHLIMALLKSHIDCEEKISAFLVIQQMECNHVNSLIRRILASS